MRDASIAYRISRKDVENATKEFFKKGGKIEVLPPQVFSKRVVIGDNNMMAFEDPELIVS
ncbi:MAG: hypothetical protein HQM13_11495 [SAR324 cluster bacterium]|nr:hypothetical protein [SAR324 cluster bacterium]